MAWHQGRKRVKNRWEYLDELYENLPRQEKILHNHPDELGRPLTELNVSRMNRHNRAMRKLKELAGEDR
jgi:hypothetical protein